MVGVQSSWPRRNRVDNQTATILIVDSEKTSRDPLAQELSTRGYEVLTAQDGLLALQILGGRAIDLVLLEAKMPGLDGLDILKALRKNAATEALPVIMLSGSTNSDETLLAFEQGANDYINKPFQTPILLA